MRRFILNGQAFNEGDLLTITTAEHGTFEASTKVQSFSYDKVVGLELTPTVNQQGCERAWSAYSNGDQYHSIQLAYHCRCPYGTHRRYLQWLGVRIDGNQIQGGEARPEKPLPPLDIPFRNLPKQPDEPMPQPPVPEEPVEEVKTNRHGQIQLF